MPTGRRGTAVTRAQVHLGGPGIGAEAAAAAVMAAATPAGETATAATIGPKITATIGPLNVLNKHSDPSNKAVEDSSSNSNSLNRPP